MGENGSDFGDGSERSNDTSYRQPITVPLLTILSASLGLLSPSPLGRAVGSLRVVSVALATLMLSMDLTVTPAELTDAVLRPKILAFHAAYCFLLIPVLALLIKPLLYCDGPQTIDTVLLGSVRGGHASNLFALLVHDDVGLSVVFILSTTLLGTVAMPFLVARLLGHAAPVDPSVVLAEVVSNSLTLAYLLSLSHFRVGVAAAALVSLSVLGAQIAVVWGSGNIPE